MADDSKDKATPKEETKMPEVDPANAGKTELFVQQLSYDTTEDSLRALFEPFGELTKCKVMRGKAFVEYLDHETAAKALAATNEADLDGRKIWVEFSGQAAGGFKPQGNPDDVTTVFVGNLGFRTTKENLEWFFGECGTINAVRIALGEDERPRGFAHVEFSTNAEALEAMKLAG